MAEVSWIGASYPGQALAKILSLPLLPQHIDRILFSLAIFQLIYAKLADLVASVLIPKHWESFTEDDKRKWRKRIVSFAHSIVVGPACLYAIWLQPWSPRPNIVERLYQTYDLEVSIADIGVGYFAWHFLMEILQSKKHGFSMVIHATIGIIFLGMVYYPLNSYYLMQFLQYEITNPFLNIYQCLSQIGMETSPASIANAVVWIVLFFFSRIIAGTLSTLAFWQDIIALYRGQVTLEALGPEGQQAWKRVVESGFPPRPVPSWMYIYCLLGGIGLAGLNYIWFYMIVRTTIRKLKKKSAESKR